MEIWSIKSNGLDTFQYAVTPRSLSSRFAVCLTYWHMRSWFIPVSLFGRALFLTQISSTLTDSLTILTISSALRLWRNLL